MDTKIRFMDWFKKNLLIFYYKLIFYFGKNVYMYWYRHDETNNIDNFGDIIGPKLFEYISGIKPIHIDDFPIKKYQKYVFHFLTVGSVLVKANKNSIVWGSGITDYKREINSNAKFLLVRGPYSKKKIVSDGGTCPSLFGDPALLLPLYFQTEFKKQNKITLIPHLTDNDFVYQYLNKYEVDIVNLLTNDFEETLKNIISSNVIISSSLHGLILAVAYDIPCIWAEFGDRINGDGIKYIDFFESVNVLNAQKFTANQVIAYLEGELNIDPIIVNREIISLVQNDLISTYPLSIKK